ncbi:hypothetical protein V8B97DRAFT_1915828 [Scleroderma yunnanense]
MPPPRHKCGMPLGGDKDTLPMFSSMEMSPSKDQEHIAAWTVNPSHQMLGGLMSNAASAHPPEQMAELLQASTGLLQADSTAMADAGSISSQMSAISLLERPSSNAEMVSPVYSGALWLSAQSILHIPLQVRWSHAIQSAGVVISKWRPHKVNKIIDKTLLTTHNKYTDKLVGGLVEWRNLVGQWMVYNSIREEFDGIELMS